MLWLIALFESVFFIIMVAIRVVSLENFRKFIPIFPEISGNLLKNVFFHFILFNYNHIKINIKHVLLQITLQIFVF